MSGYRLKKKPTTREISNVVIELGNRVNSLMGLLSELEKAFSLYVEMKKDDENFTKYIDEKVKEYEKVKLDSERDETVVEQDIPTDSSNEGSGTKRIRKKAK